MFKHLVPVLLGVMMSSSSQAQCERFQFQWGNPSSPPGVSHGTPSDGNAAVYALCTAVLDSQEVLLIGGDFDTVAGVAANNFAIWDGSAWSTWAGGISSPVHDIIVFNGEVYVACSAPLGVRRWNGSSWSVVGSGLSGTTYALAEYQDELYVGGSIIVNNGGAVGVLRANAWEAIVADTDDEVVFALHATDQHLFIGGVFDVFGGTLSRNTIAFDGTGPQLMAMCGGVDTKCVTRFESFGTNVYVAGWFTQSELSDTCSESEVSRNLIRWVGAGFQRLNANLPASPIQGLDGGTSPVGNGLLNSGGVLHVGGRFAEARPDSNGDALPAGSYATWNGTEFATYGCGFVSGNGIPAGHLCMGLIEDFAVFQGKLVVGGRFVGNGAQPTWGLATYELSDIDFNNDGLFPDVQDVADLLAVFSGGSCSEPYCDGIDFDGDCLYPDTEDISAFLRVFSGGDCDE